ncbi:carbamoyl-phosphate synthase L chain, ATP binding domain-containing protein [Obelidium mucronatum]|nr:carbamoyl-phosphate synthase L chain, ATP binding domain-containing protein [Obelidium mucronatum]
MTLCFVLILSYVFSTIAKTLSAKDTFDRPSNAADGHYGHWKDFGKTFDKILIANRGEIAVRVIKTAKKMGIKTVAVYSDADANSLHVRLADEAVNIGPAPTNQSYLVVENIIKAVKQSGAQAVHPGYGFLSENSHFVSALDEAGVTFIGPNSRAMFMMGDKIESKKIAKAAGVHTIPGYDGEIEDVETAVKVANDIGYPVMVKASAGGGGKGMRIAYNDKECREAFRLSKAEAKSKKFIEDPRHIEIQLIGDQHGNTNVNALFKDVTRRSLKKPHSVHIDEATRRAMGEQAVALAKNVGYFSAGTCEFLVDPQRNFYFLEMNTRLQVEHPITEYITNLDLVELMIRVAAKQKLEFDQSEIAKPKGWAFESRVYAEDPEKYLPSIGRLTKYIEPKPVTADGHDVRCDSGIVEGSEISIYYDPMICKLCTYGETREVARHRMESALDRYVIKGVTHNVPLLRDVISHPRFASGKISTKFLAQEYPKGFKGAALDDKKKTQLFSLSAVVHAMRDLRKREWISGGGSLVEFAPKKEAWELHVSLNKTGEKEVVHLNSEKDGSWTVKVGDHDAVNTRVNWEVNAPLVEAVVAGENVVVQFLDPLPVGYRLQYLGTKFEVSVQSPRQHELSKHMKEKPKLDLTSVILSPMPGTVVSVAVKEGDVVAEGAELGILEAMKMQNVVRSPRAGKVAKVSVKAGQSVAGDEIMIELEKEVVKKA